MIHNWSNGNKLPVAVEKPFGDAVGVLFLTSLDSKRAHLRAPALQTPPKFHKKTPEKEEKNAFSGGRGNKREILGSPPFGPPPFGPPTLRGPHPSGQPPFPLQAPTLQAPSFWVWVLTPLGPHNSHPHPVSGFGRPPLRVLHPLRPRPLGAPPSSGNLVPHPSGLRPPPQSQKSQKLAVAKVGLAKQGRGQTRSWPKAVVAKLGRA